MQRIRFNGLKEKIFWLVIPVISLIALVVLDQLTKYWFTNLYNKNGNTEFISGVLSFTYTVNTGSAFSFLSDKAWAQTFFKIITVISLIVFVVFAPKFWNGFCWTPLQCAMCALTGAVAELLMEIIFSPFGYKIVTKWREHGVGREYLDFVKGEEK